MNPSAVRKYTDRLVSRIHAVFGDEAECVLSEYPGHAIELAAASTADEVYAVGGDGTVREVAEGITKRVEKEKSKGRLFKKPIFSVIPAGSGNDFARSEYGENVSPFKVIDRYAEGKYDCHEFDIGTGNDNVFVNIASVGFDAEIVKNAERFKKNVLTRKISYILSLLYTVFRFRGIDIEMDIDGEVTRRKMLLLAVANGQYYGGGIWIAPKADMQDGLFDIICIPMMNPLRTFVLLPTLLKGSHLKRKEVIWKRGKKIDVRCPAGETLLNLDGELSKTDRISFRILPSEMHINRFVPST